MIKIWNKLRNIRFAGPTYSCSDNKVHEFSKNDFGKYDIVNPQIVSQSLTVPNHICKPPYAENGIKPVLSEPEIKNENQIEGMRQSCLLAKIILQEAEKFLKPGVTTDSLDKYIHEMIINNCAYPSPLHYKGFPKSICTSINNVVAHGIPDNRSLRDGDIINVDITVFLNGFHGDCSNTFEIGEVDEKGKRLIQVTNQCLNNAIEICKPGQKFCNIGKLIEKIAKTNGFNIVPCLTGHGIGAYFHGPPDIFHCNNNLPGVMLPGMTFTIEPVLTQGSPEVCLLEDGWTIVTEDNARTAQAEHTILITDQGFEVLT